MDYRFFCSKIYRSGEITKCTRLIRSIFFFVLGFCIKLLQQQQQPQFLTKSTPPIFFSHTHNTSYTIF